MSFARLRRRTSFVTSAALAVAGAAAVVFVAGAPSAAADPAPIQQPSSSTVTADALPTAQIDGVAWAQVVVGNTVYVGGSFTTARPAGAAAGTNTTPRANMLAYDITTGNLITSFAPSFNAQVRALAVSPDGTRLYAAGDFTTVNGAVHNRIAAFNAQTGALITTFTGGTDASTKGVTATNTTVYVGGLFSHANGVSRGRLAAFAASNGALTAWAPSADYTVNAMVMSPDKSRVIAGGAFANVSGTAAYGLAMIDAGTGALIHTNIDSVVRDAGTQAAILSLSADANAVYGVGYVFGAGGNFEGTFSADPTTGNLNWMEDCHGDTYGAFSVNNVVYTVSHAHFCANIGGWPVYDPWQFRHSLAFTANATGTLLHNSMGGYPDFYGQPSPTLIDWFPDFTNGKATGQSQAAWSVTGNGQYVVEGGEFPTVNGTAQQGLVRFAVRPIAPAKSGPMLTGAHFFPSLVSLSSGTVRVAFASNWDRDSKTLNYKVVRNGDTAHPVWTTDADSEWWNTPTMGFVDTGLTPGATYRYRVYATDPDGNQVAGDTVQITLPTTGSQTDYDRKVLADGAASYWPLSEASGSTFIDNAAFNDLDVVGGVTRGAAGPVTGEAGTTFDGSTATSSTRTAVAGPNVFTLSTWVKTTSTSGGKIVGFGNSQNGTSSSYDRHLYLDNAGHVWFGVYNNTVSTLHSAATVNDGSWHQIAASLGADGMSLYVDGVRVGHRSDVTSGQDYTGFWRIGGDNLNGWTNQPASTFVAGSIADVAVFPFVLPGTTVQDEYVASGRAATVPQPPADGYGKVVYADQPDLYWRLDDPSGPTAADASANSAPGLYSGGVLYRTPSPVTGATGTGATFDGAGATIGSGQTYSNPTVYSEEAWFNTTTTHGGKIIGFGNAQSGNSSAYDRHVYMENDGRLDFGTWTGTTNIAQTIGHYNDGVWHHVVATQGPDGMTLYVDGQVAATNPQTQAQAYDGYWRVGGDSDWGGDSPYLAGSIDEVAVYSYELTAAQVQKHFAASAQSPNLPPTAAFTSSCTNTACSFDGTGSSDADGTIASYAWTFGDGASSTSATPNHTYAGAGTYSVKLTVTDNDGATDSVTKSVTVTAPPVNQPPTAAFTATPTNLSVAFDGTGSTDPDGTIASYAWTFGDGASSTSATPTHAYAGSGTYTVKLTVTDNDGATDTATKSVSVTAPNQPPTAAFTATPANLSVAFDGSGSSDPDGTIASYAWDFGDGASASIAKPNHAYANPGTYSVKLTVTDDGGASAFVVQSVTVAANAVVYAADTFTRTVSNGFGSAPTGGAWTLAGSSSLFQVTGGVGQMKVATAGAGPQAFLNSVSAGDVDALVDVSVDKAPTGGGTFAYLAVRHSGSTDYRVKVKLLTTSVTLYLTKVVSGTETVLASKTISGLTYAAGNVLRLRFDASGSGTTALSAKVWKVAGGTEPAAWQVTATDSTAALQSAGGVGLQAYLATSATTVPVFASFDNLSVGSIPTP